MIHPTPTVPEISSVAHDRVAGLTHSVLVSGRIDTVDPWDLEVPFILWVCEWSDKSTRGGIDVNGDRDSSFGFILVKFVRHALDGLEHSGIS